MTKTIQLHKAPIQKPTSHSVTKEDVMDAIEYLHVQGFVDDMNYDQQHYVKILLRKAANVYKILLEDENGNVL